MPDEFFHLGPREAAEEPIFPERQLPTQAGRHLLQRPAFTGKFGQQSQPGRRRGGRLVQMLGEFFPDGRRAGEFRPKPVAEFGRTSAQIEKSADGRVPLLLLKEEKHVHRIGV